MCEDVAIVVEDEELYGIFRVDFSSLEAVFSTEGSPTKLVYLNRMSKFGNTSLQ
jgi:hypothetical protein